MRIYGGKNIIFISKMADKEG